MRWIAAGSLLAGLLCVTCFAGVASAEVFRYDDGYYNHEVDVTRERIVVRERTRSGLRGDLSCPIGPGVTAPTRDNPAAFCVRFAKDRCTYTRYGGKGEAIHEQEWARQGGTMDFCIEMGQQDAVKIRGFVNLLPERRTITFPDGHRYEGEFANDSIQGRGVMISPNGDRYDGQWVAGNRHGRGTMTFANGQRYEGEWREGKMTGRGVMTSPSGERYEGDLVDGVRTGRGAVRFGTGITYDGDWRDDRMTGRGVMTWPNRDRYEGDFVDGVRNGRGSMRYGDGGQYEGEWRDNLANGNGIMIWPNGQRYTGQWLNGNRHGRGTHMTAPGQQSEGEWRDDRRVGTTSVATGDASSSGSSSSSSSNSQPGALQRRAPPQVWLGTQMMPAQLPSSVAVGAASGALRVDYVLPGAPAEAAGIRENDYIVEIAGKPVDRVEDLIRIVNGAGRGSALPVVLMRNGQRVNLNVTPVERPANSDAAMEGPVNARANAARRAAEEAEFAGDLRAAFNQYVTAYRLGTIVPTAPGVRMQSESLARIMALAPKLPGLGVPEEADRHNRRAIALLQNARTFEDNDRAALELWQAIYEAPWVPDLHLNRGLVLDKSGHTEAAIQALRVYLSLNPQARDADAIRQKIAELEVLADERKAWLPFTGLWSTTTMVHEVDLRGRTLSAKVATPPPGGRYLQGETTLTGTIRGSRFAGKVFNRPSDADEVRCFGRDHERDAEGGVDGDVLRLRWHAFNYNKATCQITASEWKPYLELKTQPR